LTKEAKNALSAFESLTQSKPIAGFSSPPKALEDNEKNFNYLFQNKQGVEQQIKS